MKDAFIKLLVLLIATAATSSLGCSGDEDPTSSIDYYCSLLEPSQNFCHTGKVNTFSLDVPRPINESTFWVDLINDDHCYISVEANAPDVIKAVREAGFVDYEGPYVHPCPTDEPPDMAGMD